MKNSTDVWLIAYIMHKGHKIKDYKVIARGKVSCSFDIDDREWQKLKLEFNNSEISEFKALIDKVKDLAF